MEYTGKITKVSLGDDYLKSAKLLGEVGWLIPMDLYPYTPVELCKEPEKIDEQMYYYYSNDIRFTNMVGELIASKIAKKHRGVILQAYSAYKTNLFTLCISSLNPLYEGFLSEIVINKRDVNMKNIIEEIGVAKNINLEDPSLMQGTETMFFISLKAFIEQYTKNIPFSEKQDDITRHNIAHGRINISDSCLEVIRMFSNLYNMSVFFSNYVK